MRLTRKQEQQLDGLLRLAGSGDALRAAIVELNRERKEPPTLRDVVRRLLERSA